MFVASADWPAEGGETAVGGAILAFELAAGGRRLGRIVDVAPVRSPSYLARHPRLATLYASTDVSRSPDASLAPTTGAITAFKSVSSGALRRLNSQPTGGSTPCQLAVDPQGSCVVSADYADGSLAVHPLDTDGSLRPPTLFVPRHRSGPDPERQRGPHAHMIQPTPDGRWFLVADLGSDLLTVYVLDRTTHTLAPMPGPPASVAAGNGPRHLVLHPSGLVFVVSELVPVIDVFAFDGERGTLTHLDQVATSVASTSGPNIAPAGLTLSSDHRFLYVANRGPDTITTFEVAAASLVRVSEVPSGGEPRAMTSVGDQMFVANMMSDNLTVLSRDAVTGRLGSVEQVVDVPAPSYVLRGWLSDALPAPLGSADEPLQNSDPRKVGKAR